jgi:hypothetical protein
VLSAPPPHAARMTPTTRAESVTNRAFITPRLYPKEVRGDEAVEAGPAKG